MISGLSAADLATVKKSMNNTQAFYYDDYKDMSDFIKQTQSQNIAINSTAFADVSSAVGKFVIANGATGTFAAKSQGLAVWMPTESYDMQTHASRYEKLVFNQDTNWLKVLKLINP